MKLGNEYRDKVRFLFGASSTLNSFYPQFRLLVDPLCDHLVQCEVKGGSSRLPMERTYAQGVLNILESDGEKGLLSVAALDNIWQLAQDRIREGREDIINVWMLIGLNEPKSWVFDDAIKIANEVVSIISFLNRAGYFAGKKIEEEVYRVYVPLAGAAERYERNAAEELYTHLARSFFHYSDKTWRGSELEAGWLGYICEAYHKVFCKKKPGEEEIRKAKEQALDAIRDRLETESPASLRNQILLKSKTEALIGWVYQRALQVLKYQNIKLADLKDSQVKNVSCAKSEVSSKSEWLEKLESGMITSE